MAQRRRIDDLMLEVEHVREENRRLQSKTKTLQRNLEAERTQSCRGSDPLKHSELIHLKSAFAELQKENTGLRLRVEGVNEDSTGPFSQDPRLDALEKQVETLSRGCNQVRELQRAQAASAKKKQSNVDVQVRQALEALQKENEQLKKKVRLLAVN
eukprot:CAMPEP_0169110296 /NCGR_PEP_ID=MMETSP1015-20121227/26435_1 /TAXON_ID=342587 /ORGANISM="Karlodinium micrum, Strain CCMP2283" /LENGTH=155 /DNA_ID=CAMNT_0009172075 /DNA_START=144 /DNA_END=611 /DNA_ORIENTATION=+